MHLRIIWPAFVERILDATVKSIGMPDKSRGMTCYMSANHKLMLCVEWMGDVSTRKWALLDILLE